MEYAFARLYTAILVAFEHILQWLLKSFLRRAVSAVVKGDSYGQIIEDKLTLVEERARDVKDQAARCSQWVIGRIDENVSKRKELQP